MASSSLTTTSTAPTSTSSGSSGGDEDGGPTSSPLLFFVALGFGVVFTNLWIIVGVKYCFRYNQRMRRAQQGGEEPIDMTAMPRPHRRRREKKLMTVDEVNERFPLTKYKAWRASRAQKGLPTEGGIATTGSRPASLKDVEIGASGIAGQRSSDPDRPTTALSQAREVRAHAIESAETPPKLEPIELEGHSEDTTPSQTTTPKQTPDDAALTDRPGSEDLHRAVTATSTIAEKSKETPTPEKPRREASSTDADGTHDEEEEDEDDPIRANNAPELLAAPGDTCAICIDNLEEDDDVRGLTCGHAFHAGCVDPWLTSRRACCPLCKADYYVPKNRPEDSNNNNTNSDGHRRGLLPSVQPAWIPSRGTPRVVMMVGGSRYQATDLERYTNSRAARARGQRAEGRSAANATAATQADASQPTPGLFSRVFHRTGPVQASTTTTTDAPRSSFVTTVRNIQVPNPFRRGNRANDEDAGGTGPPLPPTNPTPSQLEAGTR